MNTRVERADSNYLANEQERNWQGMHLFYQPTVNAKEEKIIGAEALVRWYEPKLGGNVRPNEFIPIALDQGQIQSLGAYVLFEACRQVKQWKNRGYKVPISVNVSADQLKHNYINEVISTMYEHGIDPENIKLEITERKPVKSNHLHTLDKLNDKGIKIVADDFGTRNSGLLALLKIPYHELKIDRGFVPKDLDYPHHQKVPIALIELARIIDKGVIAEGIETREQAKFFIDNDCTDMQGYHFSKPLPPNQFEHYLANESTLF